MTSVRYCLILFFLFLTIFRTATSETSKRNLCDPNITDSYVVGGSHCAPGTHYLDSVSSNITGVKISIQFPCNNTQTSTQWCNFLTVPNPANICISYECLPANRQEINLCGDNSTTVEDTVYLASPQFFQKQPSTKDCHCRITSSSHSNIRLLYVSDADRLNITAGASVVNLSTNDKSQAFVAGTVDIVVNEGRPVWLEVTGQNISVKCNGDIKPLNKSDEKSGLCSDFATTPWPTNDTGHGTAQEKDTVVYIIVGVVVCVAMLVCCAVVAVVIRRWRRRGQAKEDIQVLYVVSPVTTESNALGPNLPSSSRTPVDHAYSEVDLDDGRTGKKHSGSTKSTFVVHSTTTARTPQAGKTIPMSTIQQHQRDKINDKSTSRERPLQNVAENKNMYFILDPEHEADDSTRVKQTSDEAAKKVAEGFADESCHYYSHIKDNGKAATAGIPTISKATSSTRREVTQYATADYEEVNLIFDEDAKDDVMEKLGAQSSGPHRNGSGPNNTVSPKRQQFTFLQTPKVGLTGAVNFCYDDDDAVAAADDDGDELVMVDNVAYVSAGPPNVIIRPASASHGKHHNIDLDRPENDDDELVMIDNVAYVSAGPPNAIIRPARAGNGKRENIDPDTAENDNDECIMVDNVAYVSAGPRNDP